MKRIGPMWWIHEYISYRYLYVCCMCIYMHTCCEITIGSKQLVLIRVRCKCARVIR